MPPVKKPNSGQQQEHLPVRVRQVAGDRHDRRRRTGASAGTSRGGRAARPAGRRTGTRAACRPPARTRRRTWRRCAAVRGIDAGAQEQLAGRGPARRPRRPRTCPARPPPAAGRRSRDGPSPRHRTVRGSCRRRARRRRSAPCRARLPALRLPDAARTQKTSSAGTTPIEVGVPPLACRPPAPPPRRATCPRTLVPWKIPPARGPARRGTPRPPSDAATAHSPPTPIATRNRRPPPATASVAKHVSPEKTE